MKNQPLPFENLSLTEDHAPNSTLDVSFPSCIDTSIQSKGLGGMVEEFIENYFLAHEGLIPASGLYNLILEEVEKPLLRATLKSVRGNQKKAAEVLGINRNTLRKKLQHFQMIPS